MNEKIIFTCAVCPNGCRLSAEKGEGDAYFPLETGRCFRGTLMIGKEYILEDGKLLPVCEPMGRSEIEALVLRKRQKTNTP